VTETVGQILERTWPDFARRYQPRTREDHLSWARKAIASLDMMALTCPSADLRSVLELRQDIVDFALDAEAANG
jgi:hypothetical protein